MKMALAMGTSSDEDTELLPSDMRYHSTVPQVDPAQWGGSLSLDPGPVPPTTLPYSSRRLAPGDKSLQRPSVTSSALSIYRCSRSLESITQKAF